MNELYFYEIKHSPDNDTSHDTRVAGFVCADSYSEAMSSIETTYNVNTVYSLTAINDIIGTTDAGLAYSFLASVDINDPRG